jgi:hypothetical protein
MLMKPDKFPMSCVNLVLTSALAAGVLLSLFLGLWPQAVTLALMLVLGLVGIYSARRPDASEVLRVNAIEYRDERDRTIARDGLVVVGIVALVLSLVEYMVALVLQPELTWPLLGQVLVLYVCWGMANQIAARRH